MNFEELIIRKRNCTIYKDNGYAIKVFDKDFNKAEIFNEATLQVLMDVKGILNKDEAQKLGYIYWRL